MAKKDEDKSNQPIIIKKIKKGGGHHGGAWKVAYADFVTAMMAFFLLLWLLNVTTDEQKNAISKYFDPTHPKVSKSESGAGGVLGGLTMSPKGSMASNQQPVTQPKPNSTRPRSQKLSPKEQAKEKAKERKRKEEEQKFKKAEEELKKRIEESPELKKLAKNVLVDMTPEGLRIQIIDQDGEPMFPSASAQMYEKTRKLLGEITNIMLTMPNQISIRGHTDSAPYGAGADYTNWELSSDRAAASRRVIMANNFPEKRVNNVMGKSGTELLIAQKPDDARNRRISIILLKEELTNPENYDNLPIDEADLQQEPESTADEPEVPTQPIGTFRKTPGKIEFP
jgi:chemotaxis protein MotB